MEKGEGKKVGEQNKKWKEATLTLAGLKKWLKYRCPMKCSTATLAKYSSVTKDVSITISPIDTTDAPSADLTGDSSADTIHVPLADTTVIKSADITGGPSADTIDVPLTDTTVIKSADTIDVPLSDTTANKSADITGGPSADPTVKTSCDAGEIAAEFSEIPLDRFFELLQQADVNRTGKVSRKMFLAVMHKMYNEPNPNPPSWMKVWYSLVYAEVYTCSPLKLFIPSICLIQIIFWIFQEICNKDYLYVDEPLCSRLVYNPDRRWEVWRFLTYSFIHADGWHLIHNLFGEIIVGVSLEMAHSSWRVALVYFSGVLGGALGSAVNTADATPLTGGSGGFYALLAAHLASLLLNWVVDRKIMGQRMREKRPARVVRAENIRVLRLSVLLCFLFFDVVYWIWDKFQSCHDQPRIDMLCLTKTNYSAHLFGAVTGFLTGYLALRDRKPDDNKIFFKKIFASVLFILFVVATYIVAMKQAKDPEANYSCLTNDYTRLCQARCYNRTLGFRVDNCHVTFCGGFNSTYT